MKKQTTTIYIVEGSTGEYSDHREWPVKAFRSKVKAQRLVVEAQARAKQIAEHEENVGWSKWYDMKQQNDQMTINEFDLNMETDYTGTYYKCYPIELDEQ
jgi:hypothetical protein